MKVLHLAEKIIGGGAESVFRDTVNSLKKWDLDNVHLVACKVNDVFKPDLSFSDESKSLLRDTVNQIYSFENYRLLRAFLITESPDIIHVQNYGNLSPSILRAIYKYKAKNSLVKVVQTVHTFEYICSHFAAYDYRLKRRCTDCSKSFYKFKIFYRRCSRGGYIHSVGKGITSLVAAFFIRRGIFDKWITPSDFLKNEMTRRIFFEETKTIKNPLPDVFFDSETDYRSNLMDKKDVVVYFGRLSEEKNLQLLIHAFKVVLKDRKSARLKIVGDGTELKRLQDLTVQLHINDNVDFVPFVPQIILKGILAQAKVSVLPSKCFETASMLVFESVASEVVPIVANHGGMKEMAEWMNIGYTFADNDVHELGSMINKVLDNYEGFLEFFATVKEKISSLNSRSYAYSILKEYADIKADSTKLRQ